MCDLAFDSCQDGMYRFGETNEPHYPTQVGTLNFAFGMLYVQGG